MLAEAAKIGYTIGEKYAKATNSGGCAMIHDIEPKHLYNEWKPNAVPKRSSAVVQFCGRNLLCRIDDNGLKLPSRAMFPDGDERFTYLFELDGREYYLLRDETPRGPDGCPKRTWLPVWLANSIRFRASWAAFMPGRRAKPRLWPTLWPRLPGTPAWPGCNRRNCP